MGISSQRSVSGSLKVTEVSKIESYASLDASRLSAKLTTSIRCVSRRRARDRQARKDQRTTSTEDDHSGKWYALRTNVRDVTSRKIVCWSSRISLH